LSVFDNLKAFARYDDRHSSLALGERKREEGRKKGVGREERREGRKKKREVRSGREKR
jgi:hypothetical protein